MKKKYEVGLILNPVIEQEEETQIMDLVKETIQKAKGEIQKTDSWGRKKLAYTISKHNEGIYYFITIDMPAESVKVIEKTIRLHEKIMRFIIISIDSQKKKTNKLMKIWKRNEMHKPQSADDSNETRPTEEKEEK